MAFVQLHSRYIWSFWQSQYQSLTYSKAEAEAIQFLSNVSDHYIRTSGKMAPQALMKPCEEATIWVRVEKWLIASNRWSSINQDAACAILRSLFDW